MTNFLILILITIMGLTNPINTNLAKELAQTQKQGNAIAIAPQANFIDWFSINPSNTTYSDANTVLLSDDLRTQTKLGDRIRIKQDDDVDYKYFFLRNNLDSGYINIEGGNNYTFTSSPITEFSISSIENPEGFPSMKNFVKDANPVFAGLSTTVNYEFAYFYMSGSFVKVYYYIDVTFGVMENTASGIVDLPVEGLGSLNDVIGSRYYFAGSGTATRADPSPWGSGDDRIPMTLSAYLAWPTAAQIMFIGADIGNVTNGGGSELMVGNYEYDITFGLNN